MDAAREHGTWIPDYLYPDAVDLRDHDGFFAEEEDVIKNRKMRKESDICRVPFLHIRNENIK